MYRRLWILLGLSCVSSSAHAQDSLALEAKAILQAHCAECHAGGKAIKGGFGFVFDRELLINRNLITPGRAHQSDLYLRIKQGEMPPPARKIRPSVKELQVLQRWIDAGAPAFERPLKTAKWFTPAEVTDAILADLEQLDARRRKFTRYLTLTHFAPAGRSEKDLQTAREAAGKLLNSLSWHPRVTRPDAVDPDATILRLDLRAYKWSASAWEKLASAYPYRMQSPAESKALTSYTGTEFPAVRADWFVATASRPPFYHDLLQLPTTDRALERLLQVDVAADVQDDQIMRTGFNDSGVSKNNRLLERHDAAYGVFWRSYDFSSNSGRQNLFEHPLGPNTGATSFQPAGGEMIFHLPNGLQAYMLVDAKGRRIDKGPIEIVADPRRPDQRVETGISCMSCHACGLLFKADQLRGHVEKNAAVFGKQVVDSIRAVHPRRARLITQIEEDNVSYHKALLELLTSPERKQGDKADDGIRDPDQEPVNHVTLRFESTLDGPGAAAELGLKLDEFAAFLKINPDQARTFGTLLVKGGTAQRSVFQESFPELARRVLTYHATLAAKARPKLEPGFEGHTGTINAIAFSVDGLKAASASDDRTIRIWSIPAGKLLATLDGASSAEVYAVAFSPDGQYLLSAGRDRVLRLWDLQKNKQIRSLKGHTDSVRALAFSADGKRAASGGDDRAIRIWDPSKGEELTALAGHGGPITSLAWSRDGKKLLSGSRDGSLRWWNVENSKQLFTLEGHAGPVLCVTLSSDGKQALSGGNDQTLRLWSLLDRKELHAFKGHGSAVVGVQFHVNGREAASIGSQLRSSEDTWWRWTLTKQKEGGVGAQKAAAEDRFGCAAFAPDGRTVLVGGPAGFMRLLSW